MMPIKNRDGETEARLFFMAYTLDDPANRARRPLTFSFNGGPALRRFGCTSARLVRSACG